MEWVKRVWVAGHSNQRWGGRTGGMITLKLVNSSLKIMTLTMTETKTKTKTKTKTLRETKTGGCSGGMITLKLVNSSLKIMTHSCLKRPLQEI